MAWITDVDCRRVSWYRLAMGGGGCWFQSFCACLNGVLIVIRMRHDADTWETQGSKES